MPQKQSTYPYLTEVSVRAEGREGGSQLSGGWAEDAVGKREADLGILRDTTSSTQIRHRRKKRWIPPLVTVTVLTWNWVVVKRLQSLAATVAVRMIWMDLLRDLWRPAMSWSTISTGSTIRTGSANGEGLATHTSQLMHAIINIHKVWTAEFKFVSRYSRYMLWVPLRELYFTQMPKFFT